MKVAAVIPARLKSRRFPRKLLHDFLGKPIIDNVIENTLKFNFVDDVIIATEDREIVNHVKEKFDNVKTKIVTNARCGTERVYKYSLTEDYDYYLSVPSDEPAINPDEINRVWPYVLRGVTPYEVVTFYTRFYCGADLTSPLSCKIVSTYDDYMVYNSRAVVPVMKSGDDLELDKYKKHVGIFVFSQYILASCEYLWKDWKAFTVDTEGLEQNRFIEADVPVRMLEIEHIGFGIDSPEQVKILEERIKENKL